MRRESSTSEFYSCFDRDQKGSGNVKESLTEEFWRIVVEPSEIAQIEAMQTLHSGSLFRGRPEPSRETTFVLKHGLLYYKENDTIKGIIKLTFQRFESFQTTTGGERWYGIKISSGGLFTKLFHKSSKEVLRWHKELSRFLVNRDFFNRYEVKEIIGEGGFSQVYRICDRKSGESFAAKIIKHKMLFSDKRGVLLMKQEIDIMREMDHPNIPRLVEVHEIHNAVILVLEFVDGQELKKLRGCLSVKDIRVITRSLLGVIAYMDDLGVVHRDLKPSNVMIVKGDKISRKSVKVVDFGMASYLSDKLLLTKCGTPGYIAPEVFAQSSKDPFTITTSVDVYSIGIILYELIFCKNPFKDHAVVDSAKVVQKNALAEIDWKLKINCLPGEESDMEELVKIAKLMLKSSPKSRPKATELCKLEIFKQIEVLKCDYTEYLEEEANHLANPSLYRFKVNENKFKTIKCKVDRYIRPPPLEIAPIFDSKVFKEEEDRGTQEVPVSTKQVLSPLSRRGAEKYKIKEEIEDEEIRKIFATPTLDKRFRKTSGTPMTPISFPTDKQPTLAEIPSAELKTPVHSSNSHQRNQSCSIERNMRKGVFTSGSKIGSNLLVLQECKEDESMVTERQQV